MMQFQYHPYAALLFLSALVSGGVGFITWRKRQARGASALAFSLLVLTFWSACYGMVWLSADRDTQLLWLKIMYLGVVLTPLSFLVLILHITQLEGWLNPLRLALLLVEPLLMLAAIWTNDQHNLFLKSSIQYSLGGLTYFHWARGSLYWVNVAYSYSMLLACAILLLRSLFIGAPLYRSQVGAFLLGALIPWLVSILTQLQVRPLRELDLTPVGFALSGAVFYYAIFWRGMFDLLPVARSLLIEHISDGLIVADASLRVLDINPAAERLLDLKSHDVVGRLGSEVFPQWADLAAALRHIDGEYRIEAPGRNNPNHFFDIKVTPLRNQSAVSGYLILFRDISDRWNAEQKLRQTNQELNARLREIQRLQKKLQQQAVRDPLTGLYNRRYLEATLEQELARAERETQPVSIIMMDADKFKKINDLFGHKAGDRALQALAKLIKAHIRRSDIPCRYGGEEFVIVMPNTPLEVALARAEEIRRDFHALELFGPGTAGRASLSVGLAAYPSHGRLGEDVLDAADQAMYRAKSQGGNCVLMHESPLKRAGQPKEKPQSKPNLRIDHTPRSRTKADR